MDNVFELYEKFKNKDRTKRHFLTFNDKKIEVSLDQYLTVTRHGLEKYEYKDNEIVLKPIKKYIQSKPILTPSATIGYHFFNNDPFWVEKHDKGGFEWVIE